MKHIRTALALTLIPVIAHAHPGHAGNEAGGIGWGLAHPFTGLDHLLAALAVGMLAAYWRRASLAAVFLAAGVLGGLGGAGMGTVAGLETALALSVLAFGIALAFRRRTVPSTVLALVAVGAAAHGWAHGSEVAGGMGIAGILVGTSAIVALGAAAALAVGRVPRVITGIGVGIAAAAFAIMAGII